MRRVFAQRLDVRCYDADDDGLQLEYVCKKEDIFKKQLHLILKVPRNNIQMLKDVMVNLTTRT